MKNFLILALPKRKFLSPSPSIDRNDRLFPNIIEASQNLLFLNIDVQKDTKSDFMKVDYHQHALGEAASQAFQQAIKSPILTSGEEVQQFEAEFASYLKISHAVAVSSGTAALHLALLACGVGPGDEVITTPITFVATASAIVCTGAHPRFVDVDPFTGNLDISCVEKAIGPKTKAIIPVHLYGVMCDMEKLRELATFHRLLLIEDAAHCLEGQRNGIRPGLLGDMACFSFHPLKSITCGEGGAIVTKKLHIAQKLKKLRFLGIDRSLAQRNDIREFEWDVETIGWKYTLDNIRAAVLRTQFDLIEQHWRHRSEISQHYDTSFSNEPCIQTPCIPDDCRSAHHIYSIRVNPAHRNAIISDLRKRGVGVGIHYNPVHLLTCFKRKAERNPDRLPVAELFGESVISLPAHPFMTQDMIEYVVKTVREVVQRHCQATHRLSIVIASYNEEKTIGSVIKRIQALPIPTEVIIVDDASTDNTREIVNKIPKVHYVRMEKNSGRGPAIFKGIKVSTGNVVATFDADIEYYPEELPGLFNHLMNSKASAVFGSRFSQPNPFLYASYRWGNWVLTTACNLAWGLTISDLETAVKLIKGELARTMPPTLKKWDECPAFVAEIIKNGGTIEERPICYRPRTFSEGKKILPIAAFSILWRIFYERFLRRTSKE